MSAACPICGSTYFIPFADRPTGMCGDCLSLERHRALAVVTRAITGAGAGRSCLEAGPLNRKVFGDFLRDRGWTYTSIDRWRTGNPHDPRSVNFIDFEVDLTDMSRFGDGSFDLFITQHVLGQIDDYPRALSEIGRVLRGGAIALLEVPFDRRRATSERRDLDRFGNVWEFGADLPDHVREHFDRVEVVELREGTYSGTLLACTAAS